MNEFSDLRALIVDDEEEVLNLSKVFLKRETDRLELEVTESPEKALEMLNVKDFDVIVSDYKMPEMNGIELWEKIKQSGCKIPFLLFTGKGDETIAKKALNCGVSGYIEKKSDPNQQFQELSGKILEKAGEMASAESKKVRKAHECGLFSLIKAFELDSEITSCQGELQEIISVLSKQGSLEILEAADSGLRSSRGRWTDFGLSKKQYYSRLRSLKEAGLITKDVDKYSLSDEGSQALNILSLLYLVVEDSGQDKTTRESGGSTVQSVERKLDKAVGKKSSELNLSEFSNILDYGSYVDKATDLIEGAEQKIRAVLTFGDQRILRSILSIYGTVDSKILTTEKALPELKELSNNLLDKEADKFERLTKESLKVCRKFPFSFFLKDEKSLLVEKCNPLYPTNFFHGFFFRDKRAYDPFLGLFEDTYQDAEKRQIT